MSEPVPPYPAEPLPEPGGQPVLVGVVAGTHGCEGALRVKPETANPRRFAPRAKVWVGGVPYTVRTARQAGPYLLVLLTGVDDEPAAAALVGEDITVPPQALGALAPDTYYHYQLIGMTVTDTEGNPLGTLTEVLETGANDVYVVTTPEQEWLIPALGHVVVAVDVAGSRMSVALPQGLEPRPLRAEPKPTPQRRRRLRPRKPPAPPA